MKPASPPVTTPPDATRPEGEEFMEVDDLDTPICDNLVVRGRQFYKSICMVDCERYPPSPFSYRMYEHSSVTLSPTAPTMSSTALTMTTSGWVSAGEREGEERERGREGLEVLCSFEIAYCYSLYV